MRTFLLKYQDNVAAALQLNEQTGEVLRVKILDNTYLPYLGNADEKDLQVWWKMRGIPKSRTDIKEVLKREQCDTSELFLMKNLGLSLTDTYWICPSEAAGLTWKEVNLFDQQKSKIQFRNEELIDNSGMVFTRNPNASLIASSIAYWKFRQDGWYLFKEDETRDGQQSVNELFASMIHKRQERDNYTVYQFFLLLYRMVRWELFLFLFAKTRINNTFHTVLFPSNQCRTLRKNSDHV